MDVDVSVIDFDRVMKAIANLKDVEKDKVIQQGLKDATNLIINAGKTNLRARNHVKTGNLLYSFRSKLKRDKLGALGGFNNNGRHAHLIDRGTEDRYTSKGYYRGKIKGTEFWTDAINSNKNEAIEKIYSGIERGIQNLINK